MKLLRGACPEHLEILRSAQNDRSRSARNDLFHPHPSSLLSMERGLLTGLLSVW
jgi:hypothetical protein